MAEHFAGLKVKKCFLFVFSILFCSGLLVGIKYIFVLFRFVGIKYIDYVFNDNDFQYFQYFLLLIFCFCS